MVQHGTPTVGRADTLTETYRATADGNDNARYMNISDVTVTGTTLLVRGQDFVAGNWASIGAVRLTIIPEPGSFAMLAGCLGAGLLGTRRVAFRRTYLALAVFVIVLSSPLHSEYRIFFVGNSFINASGSAETIPSIFEALAEAGGHSEPETLMQYISGGSFADQIDGVTTGKPMNLPTTTLLDRGNALPWTDVIMTNVSSQPTRAGDIAAHMSDGMALYELVKASNPSARVTLNQSWARSTAHDWMDGDPFDSPYEMAADLWENYSALADAINAKHPDFRPVVVAPIGNAWGDAGGYLAPGESGYLSLHGSDNHHGNDRGYYLTACVNYSMFYGLSPEGLHTHPAVQALNLNVSDDQAAYLEMIAWQAALTHRVASERILIDFGANAMTSLTDPIRGDSWNNLTLALGSEAGSVLPDLISSAGRSTSMELSVTTPFDAADVDGTTNSNRFPALVTSDSLVGWEGTTPVIEFSGLNPDSAYRFHFYASQMVGNDPGPTRFEAQGETESIVVLDISGNLDSVAESLPVFPDSTGTISIGISAAAGSGMAHLGAIEVIVLPERRLSILSQPESQSVEVGTPVRLSVEMNVAYELDLQWYQDGELIPGANDSSLNIDAAEPTMDGAEFHVVASNDTVTLTSDVATLSVSADLTPPVLVNSVAREANVLELTFSEALDEVSTTAVKNYRVANRGRLLSPSSIVVSSDGRTVSLTFDENLAGNYAISVSSNVKDLAGNQFPMNSHLSGVAPLIPEQVILVDFGAGDNPSYTVNAVTWNNIGFAATIDAGGSAGAGGIENLLAENGASSGIGLEIVSPFRRVSLNGATGSTAVPDAASEDSLFGHTGSWSGQSAVMPEFKLTGMDPEAHYGILLYASRMNVDDNREAEYVLTGAETQIFSLNPVDNVNETVVVEKISADANGEVSIRLQKGANNSRSEGFVYLGAMEIYRYEGGTTPHLFSPVGLGDVWIIDWTGEGRLHYTDDLSAVWNVLNPAPTAPFFHTSGNGARFYRLEYD